MSEVKEYDIKRLRELVESRDVNAIKAYMSEYDLEFKNGKIVPKNKKYYSDSEEFWNMMQHIRKILLNEAYGAILNEGSRFSDPRIGQSVTLTGRCITRHMMAKINEIVTSSYDHTGSVPIYSDTDKNITNMRHVISISMIRWQHATELTWKVGYVFLWKIENS